MTGPPSGLEGRLRDLGLAEVLQLLAIGRKTGTLHCDAPLQGRRATIAFVQGAIVGARLILSPALGGDRSEGAQTVATVPVDDRAIAEVVFDVVRWRDGHFHFSGGTTPPMGTDVRLAVEPILLAAAQRESVWEQIRGRVPHGQVIPALPDGRRAELPHLGLSPEQAALLTHVNGNRDLQVLARLLQREVTEVAVLVHDLLAAGVLALREAERPARFYPTPPAVPSVSAWSAAAPTGEPDEDSLFDPEALGVRFEQGRVITPPHWRSVTPVAPRLVEPSFPDEQEAATTPDRHGSLMCRHGDDLARAGDLEGALASWDAALRAPEPVLDAERVRERIALVSRLHALLTR